MLSSGFSVKIRRVDIEEDRNLARNFAGAQDDRRVRLTEPVRCWSCNELGHIARRCQLSRKELIRCWTCDRVGHIAKYCRMPRERKERLSWLKGRPVTKETDRVEPPANEASIAEYSTVDVRRLEVLKEIQATEPMGVQKAQRKESSKLPRCWGCQKLGHLLKQCRERQNRHKPECWVCEKSGHRAECCPTLGSRRGNDINCWNCNGVGHKAKRCILGRKRDKVVPPGLRGVTSKQIGNISRPDDVVLGGSAGTMLSGSIEGRICRIILDTGTPRSIVRRNLIHDKVRRLHGCCLRTATGGKSPIFGEVELNLEIGGQEFKHQFLVCDIMDECILGLDFMEKYSVTVDYERKIVNCEDTEVPFISDSRRSVNCRKVSPVQRSDGGSNWNNGNGKINWNKEVTLSSNNNWITAWCTCSGRTGLSGGQCYDIAKR